MASSDALSKLTVEDIAVDSTGRVVITNSKIAKALKDVGLELDPTTTDATPNNGCNFVSGGCQTNTTAHCGAIVEKV